MKSKSQKQQKKSITDVDMIPPDGKYGWVIVISYAIANVREQRKVFLSLIFQKISTFEHKAYLISSCSDCF